MTKLYIYIYICINIYIWASTETPEKEKVPNCSSVGAGCPAGIFWDRFFYNPKGGKYPSPQKTNTNK